MISTGELKKGVAIELDGELWQILDYHHIKMGRGSAQVRIKLRNIKRGQTVERSFQAGEKWPRAYLDKRARAVPVSRRRRLPFHGDRDLRAVLDSAEQLDDAVNYLTDGMLLDRTSLRGRDDRYRAAGHRRPEGGRDRARLRRRHARARASPRRRRRASSSRCRCSSTRATRSASTPARASTRPASERERHQ